VQRLSIVSTRGLRLAATLHPADSKTLVVLAHGFTSDKSSEGRFGYIAGCLTRAGYSVLAFDFSGCGESDDDALAAAKQVEDLQAVLDHGEAAGFDRIALWGNSLGCRICLQSWRPSVAAMVLMGAGPGPVHYRWEEHFTSLELHQLAETGRIEQRSDLRSSARIVIDGQMLRDFAEFDQPAILGRVGCPVLLINGDGDEEERMLAEVSKAALHFLPPDSRHEIIPGAVHGFWRHIDRVVDLGLDWLGRHLPSRGAARP
jgi:pimeloyl-ACP methyl ester carboxylesterase